MDIQFLGWRDSLQQALDLLPDDHLVPARVFRQDKHRFQVHDGIALRTATVLGKLLFESGDASQLPATGDWVMIQPFGNEAVIHLVLPRFSVFERKEPGRTTRPQVIAANIDTVFLVAGLDEDYNVRRLERYVVQATSSGAEPVIILNKVDLCSDPKTVLDEARRIANGIEVVAIGARDGINIDSLRPWLRAGRTVAFLGSSGVGKSSLVNQLMGQEQFETGAVRPDDSRGRHTTTRRELAVLPGGGLVMDTPGMRELQLWSDDSDLSSVFADIADLARMCRFSDCRHEEEPECAVRDALETGDLAADRYESYRKLQKELAFLETRQDEVAAMNAKKRDKDFGRMIKEMKRHSPKR